MKMRMLIGALVLGAALAFGYVALSLVAIASSASELRKALVQTARTLPGQPPQTAPTPAAISATTTATATASATATDASDGDQALQSAIQNDPDLAELVRDRDPAVRGAILDFFVDQRPR
jgi:flagellar basal body-associated protein FliL